MQALATREFPLFGFALSIDEIERNDDAGAPELDVEHTINQEGTKLSFPAKHFFGALPFTPRDAIRSKRKAAQRILENFHISDRGNDTIVLMVDVPYDQHPVAVRKDGQWFLSHKQGSEVFEEVVRKMYLRAYSRL